jgi:hypothetical protein
MATQKQVDYVMSLQEQLGLEDCEKYTDEQVKAMSHNFGRKTSLLLNPHDHSLTVL